MIVCDVRGDIFTANDAIYTAIITKDTIRLFDGLIRSVLAVATANMERTVHTRMHSRFMALMRDLR